MCGIAEVLLSMGYKVSGSDLHESSNTSRLRELGAEIYLGHSKENIKDVTIMVHSSAIDKKNPELKICKEENIPLMRRAEMLAELMKLKKGIAVAGTHGKTTTTSMLTTILQESGYEPTYIIGGIVDNLKGNAKVGNGEYLIAEADESDGSFLLLSPILSVITNIDNDHMDFYGTEDKLLKAFEEFTNKIPFYGICSLNIHDENILKIKSKIKRPYVTYGINETADFEARELDYANGITSYSLYINGVNKGRIEISLPGDHNILNSLAAISIAYELGININSIIESLKKFKGVGRRFETLYKDASLEIIDDYGHHPTEILKTLTAVKKTRGNNRIKVIFEPHRYTRTRDCWNEFLHSFNHADELFLCPIYPASEKEIEGINTSRLVADINKLHPKLAKEIKLEDLSEIVTQKNNNQYTTIVALGAGSIGKKIREVVHEHLR